MQLLTIEKMAENAMVHFPEARTDDFILVLKVYEQVNGPMVWKSFHNVINNHKEYGLPSFESITRARRKILSKRPELKDEKTTSMRMREEEKFIEYSRT